MFDFENYIDRRPWNSVKWSKYEGRDVLAFWVADMDYPTPEFVIQAVRDRLEHPVLGYSSPPSELIDSVCGWAAHQFEWIVDPDWIVPITGVVPGLQLAVRAVGQKGDFCLIPFPIYPPFLDVPEQTSRRMLPSLLLCDNNRWTMDFSDIEEKAKAARTLLLCNPQNPTGRVYRRMELLQLAEICLQTDTLVISDEIHWGLVLDHECRHVPFASLSNEIANNTITLVSHTKTYNVAGLLSAIAIIPNAELRAQFEHLVTQNLPSGSPLSYAAAIAAYNHTGSWIEELTRNLRANRDRVREVVEPYTEIKMAHVEGTHLAWIDVRKLNVPDVATFFEEFGLGLSDGAEFGSPGFVRFNFAVPQSLLERGLNRFENALKSAN